jgi:hypothetical protein
MPLIISQHGNVIAADFRPRVSIDIQVKSEILYCDEHVCLLRFHLVYDGKVICTEHITAATP